MKKLRVTAIVLGLVVCVALAIWILHYLARLSATEPGPIIRAIATLALLFCVAVPIVIGGIEALRFLRSCEQ